MPAHSVTPQVSELIQSLRREGKSFRDLAQIASERLGKPISHTAIKRHLDSIGGKKRSRPREAARLAEAQAPKRPQPPQPTPQAGEERETLPEIEALEREAVKLQALLAGDMPHRDRTALTAELRATYVSIRKAREAEREEAELQSADAAWVLAKIKRFDAMAREAAGAEAPAATDEDDGLPPAARTATTG